MITVPEPRVHRLAPVLVLAVGTFAMGTDSFVLAGILPQLASGLRVSEASAGQVVTAFALTYAVTAPFLAAATGKVRRKTLLTFGLSLFIAANLASIAATGLPFLLLARIAAALGAALFTPTASAAAVALAGAERRGLALSIILGGLAVGTVFGVPAGTALGQHFGWQASLLFIAAVALVALAALLVTLPTLPLPPVVRLRDRLALLVDRRVLGIVAVTTLASAAGIIVYTYLARILLDTAGISGSALTAALLAWGIGGSTGAFGSGWLTDRHGPRRTLVLAIGILALSLLGLGFAPTAGLTPPLMAVTGAAAWSVATPNNHRLTGLAPESPSVVISANSSGIYLGQALGAAAGGLVLTAGGGAEVLCVAGATVAAAAFALNAILADH
ncbi:MFS transporter [Amycolatopsis acidicola]|uniref:MFS transporter n=1 Tax=Amycolatopsis acidicola TaxID=2596893 RepID=A0A5N0VKA6_9PSEU|nr:MFS transporter [Amycolatopsis acidicola]KAA9165590.1 MFS transporter [Amycolatopsis acidicola]